MFERIVKNEPTEGMVDYTANILSQPGESNVNIKEDSFFRDLAQPPWLITLDNFLSDEEANDLIELGNKHGYEVIAFEQTGQTNMMGIEVDSITSRQCTGQISWCTYAEECRTDTLIKEIQNRIAKITGIPAVNSEPLEIIKYEVGQYYRKHNDYILSEKDGRAGSRVLSFFIYLLDDDNDDNGGNLNFPTLKQKVRPKKGTAVLWPTVRNSNPTDVDLRTDYEIEDVKRGMVYGVTTWLHLHKYDIGCT
jgi:prolyl 4-hydroxylase